MVEQRRRRRRVVFLQAGPGEVETGTGSGVNLRINDRAARVFGRQLAVIGDQLDQEWASRQLNWFQARLLMLRSAHARTLTVYREIHTHFWAFQGLSAALKTWIVGPVPGQGILRSEAWVSSFQTLAHTGWTRRVLVFAALVAAGTVLGALWVEGKV